MWDIFIAHSAREKEMAQAIFNALAGYKVFLDFVCLKAGSDWDISISEAQKQSKITLALISGDFNKAYYAREEVAAGIALSRKNPNYHQLIPIYLDEISTENIPYGLRLKHSIFLKRGSINDLAEQIKKALNHEDPVNTSVHFLSTFPRGPYVNGDDVKRDIIEGYASLLKPYEFLQVISEVNSYRKEADPDDPNITLIKPFHLPPPGSVSALEFWQAVFDEARKHGPRMLASLLTVVPDDQFPESARIKKQKLLSILKSYR